jgi:hypothetical protein
MKLDVLDGRTSSTNRAFASDRTIKISASIATTFWIKQPNNDAMTIDLFSLKTVTGSTTFARPTSTMCALASRAQPMTLSANYARLSADLAE